MNLSWDGCCMLFHPFPHCYTQGLASDHHGDWPANGNPTLPQTPVGKQELIVEKWCRLIFCPKVWKLLKKLRNYLFPHLELLAQELLAWSQFKGPSNFLLAIEIHLISFSFSIDIIMQQLTRLLQVSYKSLTSILQVSFKPYYTYIYGLWVLIPLCVCRGQKLTDSIFPY